MFKFEAHLRDALIIGVLIAATAGCSKQEGSVEKVGKDVDQAADTTGQQIEKAGDKMEDAAKHDQQ